MTIIEFYSYLRGLNIRLWLAGDRLHYAAPDGVLTPLLREELKMRKAELVNFLRDVEIALVSDSTSIPPTARNERLPLSFAQERLWFLDQSRPGLSTYNNLTALRLEGPLILSALEAGLNEIVRRHEVLRTSFVVVGEQPTQVIAPNIAFKLPVIDLSGLADFERETETKRLLTEEAQRPFDLGGGPLIRAKMLRLGETEHVLILNLHHIVSDGWSMGVFFKELATLYEAFSKGKRSPLAELSIQYADFSVWQRKWLQGEELDKQLSYWKERMGGTLPVLELPADLPRPAITSYSGNTLSFALPVELSGKLKALSQEQGVTLYMLLLAAFNVLLMRYCGETDIIVGSPIANRNQRELEGLIGFFVNTLVLRTDLAGDPSFVELLPQVRDVCLGAYAHQDLPFEKLVQELHPQRDMSYNPLFQAMFVLQNESIEGLKLPGMSISIVEVENRTAKFDLTLSMGETEQGLSGSMEYSTDIFEQATIDRLLKHYRILLEGIAANPGQRLSELPLMDEAELHQMLIEWNDTKAEYPRGKCIHELFEEQVERTPDAVAVVFENKQLSYRELDQRANQLAHYLQKLGVGPEVLVCICLDRSLEMIVGLLGILKAGGAYVPIDSAYPPERIAFVLEDSHSPVLVTQSRQVEQLPALSARVVCLDTDGDMISRQVDYDPPMSVRPDNLAYVIYTSGSTGRPKGVLVSHYNVVRLFQATQDWFHFDNHDIWTLFHSYAFDFSVWEIWGALLFGGRLILVPYLVSCSPEAFYDLLAKAQVTVLNQTPSAFYQLMHEEANAEGKKLHLRWVIFGGEALDSQSLRPWFERHGDEYPTLVNMYGITETTVHVTYRPLSWRDLALRGVSPIGIPIPDLQIYLLDSHKQTVPVGVPGEIYVGGAGVARGYLHHPDLTADRFIPNPFSAEPNARLYKSGDLARWNPEGQLEYLGRQDAQVKLRGYRIELGEIEAAIKQYSEIRQALIMVREDQPGDRRLVAYIVPALNATLDTDILRGFLREKLPAYMIPAAFVKLDTLPLTANGKIDRKALPAPEMSNWVNKEFVAPRSQTEQILSKIWMDILRTPRVSVQDSFFEVGGDSLLAIQAKWRIQDEFEITLPVQRIFEFPRLSDLAAQINLLLLFEEGSGLPKDGNDREEYIL